MLTNDLHPPHDGPAADPVLYGVAAGLAELFPPIMPQHPPRAGQDGEAERAEAEERAQD